MTNGRPLRFLAMVGVSWTTLRIALLWQETGSLPDVIRQIEPISRAIASVEPGSIRQIEPISRAIVSLGPVVDRPVVAQDRRVDDAAPSAEARAVTLVEIRAAPLRADLHHVEMALLAMTRFGRPIYPDGFIGDLRAERMKPPGSAIETLAKSRLTFSSWMIARAGTGLGTSPTSPQLGGTQGGIRADYAIGSGLAVTGRVAAPAAGAGREASLGIAWRPAGAPVRVVAEQRVALDGGRGGPALGVSGGVSEVPLPADFKLEGYAQAGAILRYGVEHYVDGSVRMARPIAELGELQFDAGAGAWGGAQRGVARVDIGPSIGVRAPVAGRTLRLSVDWRQRVAGSARPGSGPALSLGSDF